MLSTFREHSNGANGLLVDPQGRLVACEGAKSRRIGVLETFKPQITRTGLHGQNRSARQHLSRQAVRRPERCHDRRQGRLYSTDLTVGAVYRIDGPGQLTRILVVPDIQRLRRQEILKPPEVNRRGLIRIRRLPPRRLRSCDPPVLNREQAVHRLTACEQEIGALGGALPCRFVNENLQKLAVGRVGWADRVLGPDERGWTGHGNRDAGKHHFYRVATGVGVVDTAGLRHQVHHDFVCDPHDRIASDIFVRDIVDRLVFENLQGPA